MKKRNEKKSPGHVIIKAMEELLSALKANDLARFTRTTYVDGKRIVRKGTLAKKESDEAKVPKVCYGHARLGGNGEIEVDSICSNPPSSDWGTLVTIVDSMHYTVVPKPTRKARNAKA